MIQKGNGPEEAMMVSMEVIRSEIDLLLSKEEE